VLPFVVLQLPAQAARRAVHAWLSRHAYTACLDGCDTPHDRYGTYRLLAGAATGDNPRLITKPDPFLARLDAPTGWLFGALSYEWGYAVPAHTGLLPQPLPPPVACAPVQFFEADVVLAAPRAQQPAYQTDQMVLHVQATTQTDAQRIAAQLQHLAAQLRPASVPDEAVPAVPAVPAFESNFTAEGYRQAVARIRARIRQGDCYQVNLTQAFVARHLPAGTDPVALFRQLTAIAPMPQAGLLRWGPLALVCASPERFLQYRAQDNRLVSQPIKGTTHRSPNAGADAALQAELLASVKQRAENVMIVDLVRNDLNRTAATGTVHVPQLFEVQTYPHYHHLVSTVVSRLDAAHHTPAAALAAAFPPGSMTGAPKLRAMQRIHELEPCGRGLYSGSLGYVAPDGSYDFNVVIRSLVLDARTQTASYHVGGAVTYDSDPQAEYDESLLKAAALRRLFGQG